MRPPLALPLLCLAAAPTAPRSQGPLLLLRHPYWSPSHPRQDIPILVYTRRQWTAYRRHGHNFPYAGGALSELAHNRQYVFATHTRFNWSELPGSQEAGRIVGHTAAAHPRLPERIK